MRNTLSVIAIDFDPVPLRNLKHLIEDELIEVVNFSGGSFDHFNFNSPDAFFLDIRKLKNDNRYRRFIEYGHHIVKPIFVTDRQFDDDNFEFAMELGADEYLYSDQSPNVCKARLFSKIRFLNQIKEVTVLPKNRNTIYFDKKKSKYMIGDKIIPFTRNESIIVNLLFNNPGQTYTRKDIARKIGHDSVNLRLIDTHVLNIRKKLSPIGHHFVETVRKRGYRYRGYH